MSDVERVVSYLRGRLGISEIDVSDKALLAKTKGSLVRAQIDIQVSKENFAKAAKPEVERIVKGIRHAFNKISF